LQRSVECIDYQHFVIYGRAYEIPEFRIPSKLSHVFLVSFIMIDPQLNLNIVFRRTKHENDIEGCWGA
jgi:hypothetical protein